MTKKGIKEILMVRADYSVKHMSSLLCLFVDLVVSHLGFKGGNFVLIVPVPGHVTAYHYANKPMQYTAIFHGCKNVNFQMNFYNIFSYFCSKH